MKIKYIPFSNQLCKCFLWAFIAHSKAGGFKGLSVELRVSVGKKQKLLSSRVGFPQNPEISIFLFIDPAAHQDHYGSCRIRTVCVITCIYTYVCV